MLKHIKIYLFAFVLFIFFILLSFLAVDYVKEERELLAQAKTNSEVKQMRNNLTSMITQKQKSTLAMALAISNDKSFVKAVSSKDLGEDFYKTPIEDFKKYTLYKNIRLQVLDEKGSSLYRSWSDKKGDSLLTIRKDVQEMIKKKEASSSISVGIFDLSIKAMVPIIFMNKFIGIVEVVSHFNSISKQLGLLNIDSVVLVKKEYKKQLIDPFTKMFVDDCYVANLDAPLTQREYLENNGVENYFNNDYKLENGYIIVSSEIKNIDNDSIGYYVMFKKINSLKNLDLDFLMFKSIAVLVISIMSLAIVFSTVLFFRNKRLRKYYKRIIDTTNNIVIVNDTKRLKSVNKVFFKYFPQYKSLKEFLKNHNCICELFVEEEGYLSETVEGLFWVDYLVKNPSSIKNKVKIIIDDKIHFFSANASLISRESTEYSIVLTDISLSEHYKNDLEKLTVTDTLTGIGNRRFFNQKLKEEIIRAKRYKHDLSIIILDIDFFKKINDNFGHDVGDEVLKEYTQLIASHLREGDVFCRIGGEEFVIILPHANENNAVDIAHKFRVEVEEHKKIVPITMSFGVTEYITGEEIDYIFKRADSALYEAKNSGRNRVVLK